MAPAMPFHLGQLLHMQEGEFINVFMLPVAGLFDRLLVCSHSSLICRLLLPSTRAKPVLRPFLKKVKLEGLTG